MSRSRDYPFARLAAVLLALVVGLATLAVAPASPANAGNVTGKGSVSRYTPCGDFKKGVRGYINANYKWSANQSKTRWTITKRTSTANTYDCGSSKPSKIKRIRVQTRIRFGGVAISGCSVSTGGVGCSGGSGAKTINLGWSSRKKASSVTQTMSKATFKALVAHSAENITLGRFINGGYDRQYKVSHYCAWKATGKKPGCKRRT